VIVFVGMSPAILMVMDVCMPSLPDKIPDTDNHVNEPEGDEKPAGNIASERFNFHQPVNRYSNPNANEPQCYRPYYMTQPAEKSNHHVLSYTPVFGLAEYNERKVTVRAKKGVKKTKGYGCYRKNGD